MLFYKECPHSHAVHVSLFKTIFKGYTPRHLDNRPRLMAQGLGVPCQDKDKDKGKGGVATHGQESQESPEEIIDNYFVYSRILNNLSLRGY